jgi:hypothetical protein
MKENDLIQAFASWTELAYTAGQWWITVTTALLVATYFAAKHIPPWFFALILLLYLLTALSVIFEVTEYGSMAEEYGTRLVQFRAANHIPQADIQPFVNFGIVNSLIVYATFVLGSFSAAAYSFAHWRKVRTT